MDCPCDIGVVRSPDNLKGKEIKLSVDGQADLDVYVSSPVAGKELHAGVVVGHDIFGFSIPNTKYITDYLAGHGFEAVMPDFFAGNPWSESKMGELGTGPIPSEEWKIWIQNFSFSSPDYFAKFTTQVKCCIEYLKTEKGCKKVSIIGFCWGGIASSFIASTGLVDAAVSIHGASPKDEEIINSKSPIYYITVENDSSFNAEAIERVKKTFEDNKDTVVGGVKVYPLPAFHGFVNRGSYDNEVLRKLADDAMDVTTQFLIKYAS